MVALETFPAVEQKYDRVQREGRRISIGYRFLSTRELYPFNLNMIWSGDKTGEQFKNK